MWTLTNNSGKLKNEFDQCSVIVSAIVITYPQGHFGRIVPIVKSPLPCRPSLQHILWHLEILQFIEYHGNNISNKR